MLLALLGAAVVGIYIPGYTGSAMQPGWALLWLAMPWLLWRPIPVALPHLLGAAGIACCAVTLLWAPSLNGIGALAQLIALGMVFAWASTLEDTRKIFIGLAVGLLASDACAIAQKFWGWDGIVQDSFPAGLFVDKNVFGESAALILIGLVGQRLWRWIPLALPGLLLTGTRSALVAVAITSVVWVWKRSRWVALLLAAGLVLAGFSLIHLNGSALERITIWRDTASAIVPWGHGFGSFMTDYRAYGEGAEAFHSRPQHAYSEYLEFAFETGFGVIPFVLMLVSCLEAELEAERLVVIAFLAIAAFDTPAHLPVSGFILAVAAGRLAGARAVVWRLGRDCGSALSLWGRRSGIAARGDAPLSV